MCRHFTLSSSPQTNFLALRASTLGPNGDTLKPGKALIHGTGLIGSSIGLGLSAVGWEVWGWDPDPAALDESLRLGAIVRTMETDLEGLDSADVMILAGPPHATLLSLATIETDALVTDIASIKQAIVGAASGQPHFVAGHPMAGSAASGARHASGHLFHGAKWVICDDGASTADIHTVEDLVTSLGASPVLMTAQEHDRSVALVSHLPRVLASALVRLAGEDPQALNVSAGSFRDLTRVAASGSDWWTDVLFRNSSQVESTITSLQALLSQISSLLAQGDQAGIAQFLRDTSETRSHISAPAAEVRVILFDRPGEIAKVGEALAESAVDLRDLQLRHAEHGGGGILTLSVGVDSTESLRDALEVRGFEIE